MCMPDFPNFKIPFFSKSFMLYLIYVLKNHKILLKLQKIENPYLPIKFFSNLVFFFIWQVWELCREECEWISAFATAYTHRQGNYSTILSGPHAKFSLFLVVLHFTAIVLCSRFVSFFIFFPSDRELAKYFYNCSTGTSVSDSRRIKLARLRAMYLNIW